MELNELMQFLEDWTIRTFSPEGVQSWFSTFLWIMTIFFVLCVIGSVCSWIRYWHMSPQERREYRMEKQLQQRNALLNQLIWQWNMQNTQRNLFDTRQRQTDFQRELRYHQEHPNSPWF